MRNQRVLHLKNGFNFRDLGGYEAAGGKTVKWHKLVRGSYLSDLKQGDQQKLYDYGIRTVIDLRTKEEAVKYPDRLDYYPLRYVSLPVLKQDLTDSSVNVRNLAGQVSDEKAGLHQMHYVYDQLVINEEAQEAYRRFFLTLLNYPSAGVLFHCSTGKDRTGIVAILLLALLGVPEAVIKQDYLMSNDCLLEHIKQRLMAAARIDAHPAYLKSLLDISAVRAAYFDQVVNLINKQFGGFKAYFQNQLGLNLFSILNLRQSLLD